MSSPRRRRPWLTALAIGALCAPLGLVLGGLVADRATLWHGVSEFEGGRGMMVAALALLSAVIGLVLGLVASLLLQHRLPNAPWPLRFGAPPLLVALLALAAGGLARWFADLPPTLDGERLLLAVELAVPADRITAWSGLDTTPHLELAVMSGESPGETRPGPIWLDRQRLDGDLRIVSGAVALFTERPRLLFVPSDDGTSNRALKLPLRAHPDLSDTGWSDWLPRIPRTTGDSFGGVRLRYRVLRASEPVRRDAVGAFEVTTLAAGFHWRREGSRPAVLAADAQFAVSLAGQRLEPVSLLQAAGIGAEPSEASDLHIHAIGTVGQPEDGLALQIGRLPHDGTCLLLTTDSGLPRATSLGPCEYGNLGEVLDGVEQPPPARGFLDRHRMSRAGLYRFKRSVLDTRTLAVMPLSDHPRPVSVGGVAALSTAPDHRRYVELAIGADGPRAVEFLLPEGDYRWLPEAPEPEAGWHHADRDWFDTYFEWRVDAEGELRAERRG